MNAVKATMVFLPEEMIEHVCQYLSASDLASCCAVSRIWREIFGRDRLWRVHCDEALAEVLDENNSVVEPLFKSPQPDDSTLSVISEWRLNFMKQIRLRNNWSSGNFKMEQLSCPMDEEEFIKSIFFKDHYLLMFKHSELNVWDVKKYPKLKSSFPFHTYSGRDDFPGLPDFPGSGRQHFNVFEVKGSDKFVIVDGFVVRVYSLCCVTNSLELLHVFSFELTERCSENTEERAHELFTRQVGVTKTCTVVGNVFVGLFANQSPPKMHIWNVETGQKLKEEDCPFSSICPLRLWYTTIPACEKSMNVVLEGEDLVDGKSVVQLYVYSLTGLMFFPFYQENKLSRYCWYNCIIFDNYIALSVENRSRAYNYLTSEIVCTAPCSNGHVLSFRNYVVVQNFDSFHVFNPKNPKNKIKPIQCRSLKTEVAGNMAIFSFLRLSDGEMMSVVYVVNKKIEDGSRSVSVPFYYLNDCDKYLVNQVGSKLVLMKLGSTGNIKLKVVHFW